MVLNSNIIHIQGVDLRPLECGGCAIILCHSKHGDRMPQRHGCKYMDVLACPGRLPSTVMENKKIWIISGAILLIFLILFGIKYYQIENRYDETDGLEFQAVTSKERM